MGSTLPIVKFTSKSLLISHYLLLTFQDIAVCAEQGGKESAGESVG